MFNHYINTLFATKWKISDEITDWSKKLINQIQDHVIQQRNLLKQAYTNKVSLLNTIRDQVLEQALIYEQRKDTEQINQLLDQCTTLKVGGSVSRSIWDKGRCRISVKLPMKMIMGT
jgi:hypothetical protein